MQLFIEMARTRTKFIKYKLGLGRKHYILTLVNLWHREAKKQRLRRDIGFYMSKRRAARIKYFCLIKMLQVFNTAKGLRKI